MKNIELTKDTQKLLEYTADEAEKELGAIEGHLARIDKETGDLVIIPFCMECVRKHCGMLIKLSDECLSGQCPTDQVWENMKKWATQLRERFTQMVKGQEMMSREEAKEVLTESRSFRKEMEKMVLGKSSEEESEKYLV